MVTTRDIPIIQQGVALKIAQPDSQVMYTHRNELIWHGRIQPTALSRLYEIEVFYKFLYHPKVRVLDPRLESRDEERIPHMYRQIHLCLYKPKYREWTAGMLLTETILPWTSLWLFHYEIWHATGEWRGGGEHPSMNDSSRFQGQQGRDACG